MKHRLPKFVIRAALLAFLGGAMTGRSAAQTFQQLHNFSGGDGAYPEGTLVLSNNVLFGVTPGGFGNVFKMNSDGTGFTNLHVFPSSGYATNSEGYSPKAGLILSGDTLYGTALNGGTFGNGTVFRLNADGSAFTNLHNLSFSDGVNPYGSLVLLGDTLYGTTAFGGSPSGYGTVFAVNIDGTGFTVLHTFSGGLDGARPYAGLIASENTLYGTATGGGAAGYGVVFSLTTNGGFSTLHSFPGINGAPNSEGIYPYAPLILSGNTLYGAAYQGGDSGEGCVFALSTDGLNYTKLYNFTAAATYPYTNADGALPRSGLLLSGDTLYGLCFAGGVSNAAGTVYAVKTNGTDFVNLHSFDSIDGYRPTAGLVLVDNTLYGTVTQGGLNGYGAIFSISLAMVTAPSLAILRSGSNVVLSWPTSASGFSLQFSTNLVSPVIWNPVTPLPTVIDGQYTVTNSSADSEKYYRLNQ